MTATQTPPGDRTAAATPTTAPPPAPPQAPATRARLSVPRTKHLSAQARPHVAMACLLGAATAAQAASALTGQPAVVAIGAAVVLFAAGVLLAIITRTRTAITSLAAQMGRGWTWTVAGATVTWLTTTIAIGQSWNTTAVLGLVGTALSLRWWQHHRIPNTTAPATTAAATVARPDAAVLHQIPTRWKETVACPGGKLTGAMLGGRTETATGEQYMVQLVPGKQKFVDLVNALPTIASGLRVSAADLIPEAVPGDDSQAKLTVLTNSPLRRRTVLTEIPDAGPGRLPLGPWGDGDGDATWRLYTTNSMWGGVVIGGVGSGKSVLLTQIATAAHARGDTIVWFVDGQDGSSSPELIDLADWAAGRERATSVLRAAADIVKWRSRQNVNPGKGKPRLAGFTPSPQRPGIVIIVDECHLIYDDETNRDLAEFIARLGRKTGVVLVCGSQYAGIKTFGGSKPLRSSIMQGNAIAMWTTNKGEKNFFPTLDLNPADLPAGMPGMGYLIDVTGSGKSAPFRSRDFERLPEDAPADATPPQYSVSWWWGRFRQPALDRLPVTAADKATDGAYTNRAADLAADFDKWADAVRAMEAGIAVDDTRPTTTGPKPPVTTLRPLPLRGGRRRFGDILRGRAGRPSSRRVPSGLTAAETTVWRVLADGPHKLGELVTRTGLSETYVRAQLTALTEKGLIHQPKKFGPYRLIDDDHNIATAA